MTNLNRFGSRYITGVTTFDDCCFRCLAAEIHSELDPHENPIFPLGHRSFRFALRNRYVGTLIEPGTSVIDWTVFSPQRFIKVGGNTFVGPVDRVFFFRRNPISLSFFPQLAIDFLLDDDVMAEMGATEEVEVKVSLRIVKIITVAPVQR